MVRRHCQRSSTLLAAFCPGGSTGWSGPTEGQRSKSNGLPERSQTHTSIQRAWHRHAIKGQRRAASSTYRRCVSAQNGSNGWPRKHPISMEMFDNVNNETMWMNITYERRFILAGVYRIETLQQECKGIVNAVLARCGDELDKSLAYKHAQTTANHTS